MANVFSRLAPVIDTSPLIFLSKTKHFSLLRYFFPSVTVPQIVALEISQYGASDPTWIQLQANDWLIQVATPPVPEVIKAFSLDPGESAVLGWAYLHPGTEAILDDLAGRRCANQLGIPVRGTLGLVLAAKKRGYLPLARPVIEDLKQAGMYLSERVINQALALVGE